MTNELILIKLHHIEMVEIKDVILILMKFCLNSECQVNYYLITNFDL